MSLKGLLAELQSNYILSFPDKVKNLRALWEARNYIDLQTEYHKLKGTGRTYGLPEISELGEAVESLCLLDREKLDTAVPLSLELLSRIHACRVYGGEYKIKEDPEFQVIQRLIDDASKAAS